jgi:hypothetical protein
VVAALGIALAIFGAWTAVRLGPSGTARFSATSTPAGAIVVGPGVLSSLDVPVRVRATRADGGTLTVAAAASADAQAVLARSAVSSVRGVRFATGGLDLGSSGAGALPDINDADVWRASATGEGSAELVLGQGSVPETAVVTSGDPAAPKGVTMTLTWVDRSWFLEALGSAVLGAVIAVFAIGDLRRRPRSSVSTAQPAPSTGEVGT